MNAKTIKYDRWHGQHLLDKLGVEVAYPFGYGLLYTTFALRDLRIDVPDLEKEEVQVSIGVKNTGDHDGRFIAQVYGLSDQVEFPQIALLGFKPVDLSSGEHRTVTVSASLRPLQRWVDVAFVLSIDDVTFEVAAFAGDPGAVRSTIKLRNGS
ncbi:hypothetical protein EK21DRAFT_107851 [Setomelanomma holmii]|uniref:beta-glucosidase n=1 Tax=Setomelanomma holmii TaxID=210430 RepID=A0A9P4LTG4_9PLEO|nr:hypothetical protein EK21DRAFT_107851 [Setomelanomma holmii]